MKAALVELSGVGPKVADCVALFSLDKLDIVPVDTHVWQIAQRYYHSLRRDKDSETGTGTEGMERETQREEAGEKLIVLYSFSSSYEQICSCPS